MRGIRFFRLIETFQRKSSFLINRDNLHDEIFYDPNYPTFDLSSKKPIAEKLEPLKSVIGSFEEPVPRIFEKEEIYELLTSTSHDLNESLFCYANMVVESIYDKLVLLRGIIEFSNVCSKNCNYCGIRAGNKEIDRYRMTSEEIVELALECNDAMYGTLMLQSGETHSDLELLELCDTIKEIKEKTNGELCVALSVGELTHKQYSDLYEAGATRYLLRIESSNPDLYSAIHPGDHSFETREQCIRDMQDIGFYVGTGVLINIPGQTVDDLVSDQEYFVEKEIDMIGMGPYIIQNNTPMAEEWKEENEGIDMEMYNLKLMTLCLKMLSIARIQNPYSNISATTALQLLHPKAREMGLHSGANVVMPILTPPKYREKYKLYERKPIVDNKKMRDDLFSHIREMGKELCLTGEWGNPLTHKMKEKQ